MASLSSQSEEKGSSKTTNAPITDVDILDLIAQVCARLGFANQKLIVAATPISSFPVSWDNVDGLIANYIDRFARRDKSLNDALGKYNLLQLGPHRVFAPISASVKEVIKAVEAHYGPFESPQENKSPRKVGKRAVRPKPTAPETSPEPLTPVPSIATFKSQSLLNDTAILQATNDRLGFGTTAEAIASFIASEKTATPLVMAVNAPWGTGKSSLVNMILNKLERQLTIEKGLYMLRRTAWLRPTYERWRKLQPGSTKQRIGEAIRFARPDQRRLNHTVLRFDAWMHDDAKSIVSAFTRQVIYRANSARHMGLQIVNPVSYQYSGRIARVGILATCGFVGYPLIGFLYAELVALGILPHLLINQVLAFLKIPEITIPNAVPAGVAILGLIGKQVKEVQDTLQKFIKNPEKSADEATLARVNEKLRGLLQQATTRKRRFIIYIDNLERCKPENALALLEVVNQLLNHPQVITIIAADMELIAASAGSRFKDQAKMLATTAENEQGICLDFGRRYVRKMVQMNITVPRPSMAGLRSLVGGTDETS